MTFSMGYASRSTTPVILAFRRLFRQRSKTRRIRCERCGRTARRRPWCAGRHESCRPLLHAADPVDKVLLDHAGKAVQGLQAGRGGAAAQRLDSPSRPGLAMPHQAAPAQAMAWRRERPRYEEGRVCHGRFSRSDRCTTKDAEDRDEKDSRRSVMIALAAGIPLVPQSVRLQSTWQSRKMVSVTRNSPVSSSSSTFEATP